MWVVAGRRWQEGDGIARRRRIWWWRWPRLLSGGLDGWGRGDREAASRRRKKRREREGYYWRPPIIRCLVAGAQATTGGARASRAKARALVPT